MLYVFLVDTGTMLTFDMNLAMESVARLRTEVSRVCQIPEDKQVLLISGGENLEPESRVCSYSAGTDTNPIFLFSKSTIEAASPPSPSVYYGSDRDLKAAVDGSLNMPSSYETVVARAQLALQFHDIAKEDMRSCERLVHDQHLQHQGWAAVIANLEDITTAFRTGTELFKNHYEDYFQSRETYRDMLLNFGDAITLLGKTPLLQCLQPSISPRQSVDGSQVLNRKPLTLLEWISLQDSKGSLQQMAEQAAKEVDQFDKRVCDVLMTEVGQVLTDVDNVSMKEVKGLEDRLYSLEQLMFGARKIVQEQADMAQGFVQNQNRAGNLRDPSILPDLCASHKTQMILMLTKHQQLRDIRRKCSKAKEELSINLHTRLRWVMYVEKAICDTDAKLNIHNDNMKRLKRKLEILQQMYNAPKLYAIAVVEVLRRKQFSQQYCQWAVKLAGEASTVHKAEVARRKEFLKQIGRHFLLGLFTGLNEMPTGFATEAPESCDRHLPPITEGDMLYLQQQTPELADLLKYTPASVDVLKSLSCTIANLPGDPSLQPSGVSSGASDSKSHANDGSVHLMDETLLQGDDETGVQEGSIEVLSLESADHKSEYDSEALEFHSVAEQTRGVSNRQRLDSMVEIESNEFMTADFYIEESLPSSYSDSQKQMMEKIADLQNQLQDKVTALDKSQAELGHVQTRLHQAHERFKNLGDLVEKDSLKLKCEVLSIEKHFQKERDDMSAYMDEVTDRLKQVISSATKWQLEEFDKQISTLKTEHDTVVTDFQEKLSITTAKLTEAQQEVVIYHEQLKSADHKYDCLKDQMNIKLDELSEKLTAEKNDAITKLNLEQELELDKMKSDFFKDIENKELELSDMKTALTEKIQSLEVLVSEQEVERSEMFGKFQADRDELERNLREELGSESDKKLIDLKTNLEKEHAEKLETIIQQNRNEYLLMEKELAKSHEAEVERIKTEINQLNDKAVVDLTQKFETDKQMEITELTRTIQAECQHMLVSNRPVLESLGMQTSLTATDEGATQTVAIATESGEMQTSVTEMLTEESQTTTRDLKSIESQTQLLTAVSSESQTDVLHNVNVESDSRNTQTELSTDCQQTQTSMKEVKTTTDQASSTVGGHVEGASLETISGDFHVDLHDYISLDKHGQIIAEIKKVLAEEQSQTLAQVTQEMDKKHEEEISLLVVRMQRDKQDSLSSLKSSITAEQQVAFNAAVDKIVMSKDKIIDEFKRKESSMLLELEKEKGTAEKLHQGGLRSGLVTGMAGPLDQERVKSQEELEIHLQDALSKISKLEMEKLGASIEPASLSSDDRVQNLERTLQSKEEELKHMNEKMMELSMSASVRGLAQQDKVSIMTCNVGDTVLLCLDERHDQYVVFTVGTTLHFLHTDCMEPLGLKTAPGDSRKSWVLAEITDKEYCQAKKNNNRFRVQVGTKFYRVKAKPWDKERVAQKSSLTVSK